MTIGDVMAYDYSAQQQQQRQNNAGNEETGNRNTGNGANEYDFLEQLLKQRQQPQQQLGKSIDQLKISPLGDPFWDFNWSFFSNPSGTPFKGWEQVWKCKQNNVIDPARH